MTPEPSLRPCPGINVAYNRSLEVQHGTHITPWLQPVRWHMFQTATHSSTMEYLVFQEGVFHSYHQYVNALVIEAVII